MSKADALTTLRVQSGSAARASLQFRVFRFVVRMLFQLLFRVRVIGRENLTHTQAIICANHLGWAEGFMLLLFLPPEPRIYGLGERDVATRSQFRMRLLNWLEIFIPLDRDKPRQALLMMEDVLRRGGSLAMAPEGQMGKQEGAIGELQRGAAHLSVRTGVPLVPVGVTGSLELWFRRTLTMRIGKPIYPNEFEGDPHTRSRAMTARLDKELRALLPGDFERPRFKPFRETLTKLF